jgi:hypothetical protein
MIYLYISIVYSVHYTRDGVIEMSDSLSSVIKDRVTSHK